MPGRLRKAKRGKLKRGAALAAPLFYRTDPFRLLLRVIHRRMIVVMVIPVVLAVPAVIVFTPPAVIVLPAVTASLIEFFAILGGFWTIPAVVLSCFVQPVIGFFYSLLTIVVGTERSCASEKHGTSQCPYGNRPANGK